MAKIGQWQLSSSSQFSFSDERNVDTKATDFRFFFLLLYWFPSPSKKVWTSQSVSDTDFLVF